MTIQKQKRRCLSQKKVEFFTAFRQTPDSSDVFEMKHHQTNWSSLQ